MPPFQTHSADEIRGRKYAGTSAQLRQAERREKLLDAARQVFGSKGFGTATVRMICEQANLTERYFYESFANSEALFVAMHRRTSEKIIARLKEADSKAHKAGGNRVEALITAYYSDILRDPVTARLFAIDAGYISPDASTVCAEWREEFGLLLVGATANVATANVILASGVVKGLLGMGVDWLESGFSAKPMEMVAAGVKLASALQAKPA